MLSKVNSSAVYGLESVLVTVEVDISSGLPAFTIVGLPNKAVEESRERVRSAVKNSGGEFPARRITVNLAPADLPKDGPQYDLPIAVGLLLAHGALDTDVEKALFIGELSLDGKVRSVPGILPITLSAAKKGITEIYVPFENASEAALASGISVYPVESLTQLIEHLLKNSLIEPYPHQTFSFPKLTYEQDMSDVIGQEKAKRALEIAAAGGHNIFLHGPPGSGKTLLARMLPSVMPELTEDEAFEITKLYSITGNLKNKTLVINRPFRSPHHTTSQVGLIGGGARPMPGEISLSHRGVLFLDEFPEYPRPVLEALRQPLEDGIVHISRASGSVSYPAKFLLIAAANPCPCGYYGDTQKRCVCTQSSIIKYQKRISGPILDRIDLHLEVAAVDPQKLAHTVSHHENSETIRQRVSAARKKQHERFSGLSLVSNSDMSSKHIKKFCEITPDCMLILEKATQKLQLSARSFYKIIKVAQTIADLDNSSIILATHISEAIQYRPKFRHISA